MWRAAFIVLLWLLPAGAWAQTATARVSQDTVEVGSRFQYQADASYQGSEQIQVASRPNFGSLRPVGQQQVPQVISINGVTEYRLSLRFALIPTKEGTVTIKPPAFLIGGKKVTANPVTVTVVKSGAAPSKAVAKKDSRFFIDATIDPNDEAPYVGQQLTLRYDLYVDGSKMDVQPANSSEPSLDDFWIQELTDRIARSDQMVSVNGRLYRRTPMWSYALFPLKAGPVEIEPASVDVVVGAFFRRGQSATLESEPVSLNVKPLPPDAPSSFYEGNVGNWAFKAETDQSKTRVGRAFVVQLTAVGEGQVSRVRLPKLPELPNTRQSDVDESTSSTIRGLTVGGVAKTRYTITPLKEGTITIPPLEFSWFDPTKGEYRTTRSDPMTVSVGPGTVGDAPVAPEKIAKRNIAADEDLIANLVTELQPLRTSPSTEAEPDPARFPWPYWVLIIGAFIAFLTVAFGPRVRAFARRAAPELEQRGRASDAVEQLDDAGGDPTALAAAIRAGLHDVWDIPKGAVTAADIADAFAKRDLDAEVASELADVLAECEAARFAPSGATLSSDSVSRARRALEKLAASIVILLALAAPARAAEWADLAAQHPDAADVQYNLGTQAAIDGDYARARLALERASYLAPWDGDVEANRALVERIVRLNTIEQSRTGRTMEGDETLFWWRVATHLNPHLLGFFTALLWLLAAGAIILRRRSESPAVRDAAAIGLIIALLLALAATFACVARSEVLASARPVVVMVDELELREGPNVAAKLKRTPPAIVPGTLLRVTDERDGWVKVVWPGDAAWTRDDVVVRVDQ